MLYVFDVCMQNRTGPVLQDRPHEPRRLLLRGPGRRPSDGRAILARRLHHRRLLHLRARGRGPPGPLHAHQGGHPEPHAELRGRTGEARNPLQRAAAGDYQDAAQRTGPGRRREAALHGGPDPVGEDRRHGGYGRSGGVFGQ